MKISNDSKFLIINIEDLGIRILDISDNKNI